MPQPNTQNASVTAAEFLTRCFAPGETIALFLRREVPRATIQRIVQLETALAPRYLAWLARENSAGANVYVAANPLRSDSRKRTKAVSYTHLATTALQAYNVAKQQYNLVHQMILAPRMLYSRFLLSLIHIYAECSPVSLASARGVAVAERSLCGRDAKHLRQRRALRYGP